MVKGYTNNLRQLSYSSQALADDFEKNGETRNSILNANWDDFWGFRDDMFTPPNIQ